MRQLRATPPADAMTSAQVEDFLRSHPEWLAAHPDLYQVLAAPARVHGEAVADHMAAMLAAARGEAHAMRARANDVLKARRAAAGMNERVQEAVLALLGAPDPIDCVAVEFAALLGVDAACLCVEPDPDAPRGAGARSVPPGVIVKTLGHSGVIFRAHPADAATFHGEAARLARHDALALVPTPRPVVLALAARDASVLDPAQGTAALAFLARALATTLAR